LCCGLGPKPLLEIEICARNSKKTKKGGKYTDAGSIGLTRCCIQQGLIKRLEGKHEMGSNLS
jgi:hypothetical protein